jgi:outer membrane protein assembly factor BamD
MHTAQSKAIAAFLLGTLLGGCASTPPYQGMSADQLFDLGSQRFQEENWGKAAEVFERLVFADPGYPRIVEARMYMARAYYNKGEYITSVSEFTRILDRHPGHPLAPEASLGICKSYAAQSPHVQRDQTATVYAWNSCENTVTDFRNHPVADEARAIRDEMESKLAQKIFLAGDFYYRRKFYHSGIIYFNDLLRQYPRNEWASQALLRLFQSYAAMEWDTEAEEVRARILREFPDSEAAREVRSDGGGP